MRIIVDDWPKDPADEVSVRIPRDALDLVKEQAFSLEIKKGDVTITIPREVVGALPEKDLYFRVVPIRNQAEQQTVMERTIRAKEVQRAAGGQEIEMVGKPMTIETNYSNRRTRVMFPLQDVKLPADPQARKAFLASLAVYMEHTDGEKELKTGNIRYDQQGQPLGIEIEVTKFSTFTILSLKGKLEQVEHKPYMTGYLDQTFKPNRVLTRAEMAAILAHFLNEEAGLGTQAGAEQPKAEGNRIVRMEQAVFIPGHQSCAAYCFNCLRCPVLGWDIYKLGRCFAEMAAIISKWKQFSTYGKTASFADTKGHWAEASIAAVVEQGIMKGYENGSFRPNQGLTRAEAVSLFNRVTGRGPLTGITQAIWRDVAPSHWAFAEIAEATLPHTAMKQADGVEAIADR
ncbi:S-layer homology domain-containing protein [Brevibacillus parabrevis]|nr:S-layer homology domain-containing protein [Brevibacillus parabrevis]